MSFGRYNVKVTDSYGVITNEVLTSGELLSFIAIQNTTCAIILRDDGSLLTVETEKVSKDNGRMGRTTTGPSTNDDGGDGPTGSGTAASKGKVRRA